MIIPLKDVVVEGVTITVPLWVNWIAVDKDGYMFGYEFEPSINKVREFFVSYDDVENEPVLICIAELSSKDDWTKLKFYVGE